MKNLYKIANNYGVKLYEIEKGDSHCQAMGENWFFNKSFIADGINLGLYKNKRLKKISFFHELGHFLTPPIKKEHSYKLTKYQIEKIAWKIGLKQAKKYNYNFSISELRWAITQLHSYLDYEKREMTPDGFNRMQFNGKEWKDYLI